MKNFKWISSTASIFTLTFLSLFSLSFGQMTNYSFTLSDNSAGATNVTATFEYTIATSAPDMILYAYPDFQDRWVDFSSVGSSFDTSRVHVYVNNVKKELDIPWSWHGQYSLGLRLKTRSDATAGAVIRVVVDGLTLNSVAGTYEWDFIRTADPGGNGIDVLAVAPDINLIYSGPAAPVATAATSVSASGFTLNWNSVSGATGYFLDVATDNSFTNYVSGFNDLAVTGTSRALTGLDPTTTYYYRLRATDGTLTSANSNTISVTTLNDQIIIFGALAAKTYGDATFALTGSASSGLSVSYASSDNSVVSISGSTVTIVGAGTANITASQAGNASYEAASNVVQSITINKASLTVTADDKTKVYGATNPSFTLSYSGFVGSDSDSDIDTPPTASSSATTSSGVGTVKIAPSGGLDDDYVFVHVDGDLTITKAMLTVTADDQTRSYGAANPTLTVTYSGFVGSDNASDLDVQPTVNTTALVTSPVGSYLITPTTASDVNYNFSYASGDLTITKAVLSVTADNKSKTYGQADPALTLTYSGFVNGEDESELDVEPTISGGSSTSTIPGFSVLTPTGGSDDNYSYSYVTGTLTINKAPLTVTAQNETKVYGQANPVFSVSYSGFVNGDDASVFGTPPTAYSTAGQYEDVGTYTVGVSGTLSSYYDLTLVSGTLTITKATVVATVSDNTRAYGDPNPTFTIVYSGLLGTDTPADLDTPPTTSTSAVSTSNVGTYTLTASGGVDNNYTFTYGDGTLTISKATLTIVADDKSRSYGGANPVLTATYAGFVGSDTQLDLDVLPSLSCSANAGTNTGTATITLVGGSDANYMYVLVNGTLTINKAPLVVTGVDVVRDYGDVNPIFSYTYAGFMNSDTEAVLDVLPTASSATNYATTVGVYPIEVTVGLDNNYDVQGVDGTLTINKATLSVQVADASRSYGLSNPSSYGFLYNGFTAGDTEADLATHPIVTTTATTSSDVGTYPLVPSGGQDPNYDFVYTNGTLTINKMALLVVPSSASKTYGDPNPSFGLSFQGFMGSDTQSDIDVLPSLSSTAGQFSDAGVYPIDATGGSDNNYELHYDVGVLTINKALLELDIDDHVKVYGNANNPLTYSVTGYKGADSYLDIDVFPTVSTVVDVTTGAGSYAITATGGSDNNYNFSVLNGTYTIQKAGLTVSVQDVEVYQGEQMPTFEYTVTGWKNGDDESDISTMPNVSAAVGHTNVLGDFLLSLQGGLDDNYYFIFNNGIMSVLEVLSTSNSAISFAVYPNPTTNYLKLEGVQLNAEIDILNAAGSVIHTGLLENGSVGVQSLKPGVYFGSVEGRIFRFVKE